MYSKTKEYALILGGRRGRRQDKSAYKVLSLGIFGTYWIVGMLTFVETVDSLSGCNASSAVERLGGINDTTTWCQRPLFMADTLTVSSFNITRFLLFHLKKTTKYTHGKWCEPRSISCLSCAIVRVRVVFRKTVVGD